MNGQPAGRRGTAHDRRGRTAPRFVARTDDAAFPGTATPPAQPDDLSARRTRRNPGTTGNDAA